MLYPYKILVVDDEEKIRKSLSGLLQDNGYEVITAGSGPECLQILSSQNIDVVILDIIMPGMSGIEVLQKIKEKHKDTEVIMITGYADKDKAVATFRLGAYDFIEKPFESSEILNTISHYLNQLELKKKIERKNRELKESEEQYHAIFNEARDGIVLIDRETGYIFKCNPEFEKQTGRRFEELRDMKIWELRSSERREANKKRFFEIKGEEKGYSGEFEFQRPEGKIVPIEFVSKVVEIQGKQFIQSITRDITERKQAEEALHKSEERFRSLVETTSDWIWEVDENAVYIYASPKIKDILGYEPCEVVGKTPFDLMPADEAERVAKLFLDISQARRTFERLENVNQHKDGRLVVLETSGVPILDTNGKFHGYRGVDREITKRKQAEDALHKSEEDLKKRVKELEEFYQMAVGRELRMKELKEEIESLKEKLEKYKNQ